MRTDPRVLPVRSVTPDHCTPHGPDQGTVALLATPVIGETHAHEISPIPSPATDAERLRRVPVPPEVITLAAAGTCGSVFPTETSRSSSPNAASRSIT